MDCIFCKIVNKEISAKIVYEDEKILAFEDLDPQAPTHVLIIPKTHVASLDELNDKELAGYIMTKIKDIAKELGLKNGYRTVINTGEDGMQTVFHLHIHLLGKRKMTWPPG
ncbi:MAG: histidine triad nucleotide-binding protein [Anaerovoracaceae bacterium]